MKDFYDFLQKMGGMHDSIITCLTWLPNKKRIEFHFEDIYSNFEGLPEYPGRQSGMIALNGIGDLSIDLEAESSLRVFEFLPDNNESNVVLVTFWPSGKIRVQFCFADYPSFQLGVPPKD